MVNEKPTSDKSEHASPKRSGTDVAEEWEGLSSDAKQYTAEEHELTVFQAISRYRKAVAWSVIVSMSLVMEGYDTALVGNFYGLPAFQRKYGQFYPGIGYQVPAKWQVAMGLSGTIGEIFGLLINGYLSEFFGYKKALLGSYVVLSCFIFITFFAPTISVLFVGEILCGFPWGVIGGTATAYASDVCPVALRGQFLMYVNLTWVIGQLIAIGILQGLVGNTTQWAYRIPFAVQWVWPLPLFILVCFAPESPWWFVRKGRLREAEISVKRLSSRSTESHAKQKVAMMVHTNQLERELQADSSYMHCFKGTNLRRTEIACGAFIAVGFTPYFIGGQTTYFLEQAGLRASNSFKLSVGSSALGIVGTVLSWVAIVFVGRRKLFLAGFFLLGTCMFLIGFVSLAKSPTGAAWASGVIMLFWTFFNDLTCYPLIYLIASEVSATRLRARTWALSRGIYYVVLIINTVVSPYMINPTQANVKGKAGFITGGFMLACFTWTYFRLPECKGRTYEELDILFKNKVPARKFAKQNVDAYENVD